MTYEEIVSQVRRRLGHKGFDSQLKQDYKYAVNWAEKELMVDTTPTKKTVTFSIASTRSEYELMSRLQITDFSEPCEIEVYDSEGNHLLVEEVTYDEWLRWNPNEYNSGLANDAVGDVSGSLERLADSALHTNKLLVSIHFAAGVTGEDSEYVMSFKPAVSATVVLRYAVLPTEDIFENMKNSPRLPEQFHHFIVPGAVYYLAQIQVAQSKDNGDAMGVEFFSRLQGIAYGEFEKRKIKVREKTEVVTKSVVAKPFIWYDDPRKYR